MQIQFEVTDPRAKLPRSTAAGLEIVSLDTKTLRPGRSVVFNTGLKIHGIPGHALFGAPAACMVNAGIAVTEFVLTEGFDAPLLVNLTKIEDMGTAPFLVEEGMLIAQLLAFPTVQITAVDAARPTQPKPAAKPGRSPVPKPAPTRSRRAP